jgi:transposase
LTQSATALKNRQEDCPNADPAAKVAMKQVLKVMEKQIAALEKAAAAIIRVHPDWENDRKLLMSVPGIGPITSLAALAEAGDLRRFRRGRQLVAFVGTSPKRKQSGTSVNGKTRMCRIGGKFLRPALYMAAVALCRLDGPLPDFYRHLVAKGKPPRAALGALMRKLLLVMRSVLIQNRPYEVPSAKRGQAHQKSPMARPA